MADLKPNESSNLIAQLARSGRMRIAAALVMTALVGGGLGVIMLRGDAGGQKLLFSGLDLQEAAEITNKLDTANVRYSLQGGGSAVFVDASKVDQARMMLSEQGLPTRGSVGWEIFDKSDTLGETQFVQNIKKVRALEGELERTIASYDMVQSARVHLAIPDRPLFQQNTEKPKASVVLKITGNLMSTDKVRAIRNLVSAQVPGLEVGAVSVSDTTGRLLAAPSGDAFGGAGGAGDTLDERKSALEETYRKKVLDVIENIAGPGAAKVTVNIDADFNRVTQTSETYDPEGRVVRSQSTVEDSSSSQDAAPGDETTVANNIPTGAAPVAPTQPKSQSSSSRTEETANYEISKTLRTEVIEANPIKRITVAVAVDHIRVPGVDGAPATYEPRPQEELDSLAALVRSAIGFSQERNDVVTIQNAAFARPDNSVEGAAAPGPFDFDKFDIVRGVEIGALLITALLLVFFVLRPLVAGLFSKPEPADLPPDVAALKGAARAKAIAAMQAAASDPGAPATAVASGNSSVSVPESRSVMIDLPGEARLDAGIDVARISGQVKASSIKKISEVVQSHPDESLAIIRSWMAEEAPDRAA
jgi:flagellar M-ring protein FliF